MSETNYRIVKNAILDKQLVVAIYEGHWRWMCPYAVGWKDGRRLGLFYQFAGSNRNGIVETDSPDNWQYIPLDEHSDVVSRPAPWFYGETRSRPAPCLDEVDAEVETISPMCLWRKKMSYVSRSWRDGARGVREGTSER